MATTSASDVPLQFPLGDLRSWLDQIRSIGKLREIRGASCHLEIGAITDLNVKARKWTLLFDQIPGFPGGHRIVTGSLLDAGRVALALGLSHELSPMQLVEAL